MEFVIVVLVVAFVAFTIVFPVLMAARLLGVDDATFGKCFLAIVFSVISEYVASRFVQEHHLAWLVPLAVTTLCFATVLKTSFLRSALIALLSFGIQFAIFLILAGVGFAGFSAISL